MLDLLGERSAVAHHIGVYLVDSVLELIDFFCKGFQKAVQALLIGALERLSRGRNEFLAHDLEFLSQRGARCF